MEFVICLLSLAVVVGRCLITPRLDLPTVEGSYEAFAHLFVGGLFGAWAVNRKKSILFYAVGISLFELLAFLVQKHAA